jgi:hypothetical protein
MMANEIIKIESQFRSMEFETQVNKDDDDKDEDKDDDDEEVDQVIFLSRMNTGSNPKN